MPVDDPNWKALRRETGLVEHVCTHGVGHPNWYSARRLESLYDDQLGAWSVHGCDGCCGKPDFPGRKMSDRDIILRLMEVIEEYERDVIDVHQMRDWCAYTYHDLGVNDKYKNHVEEAPKHVAIDLEDQP